MASINDVFNELQAVNSALAQIHADGIAETNATDQVKVSVDQVKASVDTLDADVKAGFNATVNGLTTIALIEIEAAKLLFHLTQQADTMICALEHISENTCGILTQATIQTQLQESMREDLGVVRRISEFAHPDAALENQRLAKLNDKIEECCPPDRPRPACEYKPCTSPSPVERPDLPKIGRQPPHIG